MSLLRDIRVRARRVAPQVLAATVVAYFGYHAIEGEKGVKTWARLNDDLTVAKAHLAELTVERRTLEKRVNLLNRKHLDPDLLHERALELLNYGHPDEYIVIDPNRQ
jgi:cell division protein FtsB